MNELQQALFDIMVDMDKVAREHNLKYSICAGTLLGAVRHKGFIPWDDDIDVDVKYEDLDHFAEVMEKHLPKKYSVISAKKYKYSNQPTYYIANNEFQLNKTNLNHKTVPRGLIIDIFGVYQTKRMKPFGLHFFSMLRYFRNFRTKVWFEKPKIILKLIPNSWIIWMHDKKLKKEINKDGKYFAWTSAFAKKWIEFDELETIGQKEIEFEGHAFTTYKNTDKYLTAMYGDYMKIPEEGDRQKHSYSIEYVGPKKEDKNTSK